MAKTVQASKGTSSGFVAVLSKELKRFFTDKRMVLTTILLPGLLIYVVYSVMGSAMASMFTVDEEYQPSVYALNMPSSLQSYFEEAHVAPTSVETEQVAAIKEEIANKEADALIVFSEDFPEDVSLLLNSSAASHAETASAPDVPEISVFFNSSRTESAAAFSMITSLLDTYKSLLQPTFIVSSSGATDLATEQDSAGMIFSSMLPFLVILMLFTGSMGLSVESIAGEKERGTFATMLVTPLRRWELACGKIVSISIISLLSGISSFIGIALSMPKLMGAQSSDLTAALYEPSDYLLLLVITLSTVLLFVGLISLLSAVARSVKEATTFVTPLTIIVMLVGAMGLFSQGAQTEFWFYLIPVYNSVQAMIGIFSFAYEPLFAVLTVVVNLVFTGICVRVLTWMFGNERIMFSR